MACLFYEIWYYVFHAHIPPQCAKKRIEKGIEMKNKQSSFSGSLGFVLAAAGSAP